MDILWLDVDPLVVAHQFLTFIAELATVFFEEAAELDEVEDRDLPSAINSDEFKHKFAHLSFPSLTLVSLAPLAIGLSLHV